MGSCEVFFLLLREEAGRLTVRASGDDARKTGDVVSLVFEPDRIHRFDSNGKVLV